MSGSDREDSADQMDVSPGNRIIGAAEAILNIDLLGDAVEEIKLVDWFRLSLTTFYIGVLGLVCWCLYFGFIFGLQFVISSNNLIMGLSRLVSVGPYSIVALWVFAGLARWTAQGIGTAHQNKKGNMELADVIRLAGVSVVSLSAVFIIRSALVTTTSRMFTPPLTGQQTVSILLVDMSWISLLLIGVGGLASIFFSSR